ncbi:dol-P-Glc:Glc(2)Man(9)GlcNAc(2)-PP-Dol alpha-1,2-glucosyltransferase [Onthophagus taurus]|uniref:dol-P-Glc:Glc(2)Man(9)GlcNAc(2)-PP-Dol alpha-1,2-glucosyltransferase n=1 Tax=Onthophagus taurus TaxID=166361 RepID=UPI000C204190|nr:putative Dol-P-Glc:Glc(2)Man(9)GlcNAc(2)-PP-Dol alpha-1,2-glucosyltransferase [Onthophagus taurus]
MYRLVIIIYTATSQIVFNKIYQESKTIIDEEFHISQGLQYCNFNFTTWNPKITTLPGLYLISSLILGPFNLCGTYGLRYISFISGLVNFIIFSKTIHKLNPKFSRNKSWLSALNLSLLPPLYFFNNLYYTDVISLTFVLIMILASLENKHLFAALAGFVTILIRQTNVIWVGFIFGRYFLNNYFHYCLKSKKVVKNELITDRDVKHFSYNDFKNVFALKKLPVSVMVNSFYYVMLFLGFLAFLVINKGIVVGDKTAHVAVIHIPQLFYFATFTLIFAWHHFLVLIPSFLNFACKRPICFFIAIIAMGLIVRYNTLVHPYLLADNRHYTFYIWSRFYEKISLFRFAMIVPYLFGIYCMLFVSTAQNDVTLTIFYVFCTTFVLILQKMIEVRYFLIPFVLFRLNIRNVTYKIIIFEFFYYVIINVVTLRIFFMKDIYWDDFDYVQKLIW